MAYRKTKRSLETLAKMRAGKDRARMDRPAPDYPSALPDLRRRIVIEDFDFGHKVHVLELHRTNRIDCYLVVADGVEWKKRIGWSQILAGLRKSLPRVGATME
jgi:hypothetical protein